MKSAEQKRMEAKVRQEEYNALSLRDKIKRASLRPGKSKSELKKLLRQLPEGDDLFTWLTKRCSK